MIRETCPNSVRASIETPLGITQSQADRWCAPIDRTVRPVRHWLQLSMLPMPQGARGTFTEAWAPHRYAPIGEIFLLPADHAVRLRSDCRQQHAIVCGFRPDAIGRWLGEDVEWDDRRLIAALDIVSPALRHLMLRIDAELTTPGFAADMMVELLMGQIAIELGREMRAVAEHVVSGGLAPWRLRLIDERLAEPGSCTLVELAALCRLSVRQLARGFHACRGHLIGSHVVEIRIGHARRMLADGLPAKAVSCALGFASPSNFSTAFRRSTGETPRQFAARSRSTTFYFDTSKPH